MAGNSNSGRRPDWFRETCQDIICEEKLLEFVGRVASGKEVEQRVVVNKVTGAEVVEVRCGTADRLAAFKMLAEWGVGKPVQFVQQAPRSPAESALRVDQMLDLVRQASARPPLVKATVNGGLGANGHS